MNRKNEKRKNEKKKKKRRKTGPVNECRIYYLSPEYIWQSKASQSVCGKRHIQHSVARLFFIHHN